MVGVRKWQALQVHLHDLSPCLGTEGNADESPAKCLTCMQELAMSEPAAHDHGIQSTWSWHSKLGFDPWKSFQRRMDERKHRKNDVLHRATGWARHDRGLEHAIDNSIICCIIYNMALNSTGALATTIRTASFGQVMWKTNEKLYSTPILYDSLIPKVCQVKFGNEAAKQRSNYHTPQSSSSGLVLGSVQSFVCSVIRSVSEVLAQVSVANSEVVEILFSLRIFH